MFSKTLRSAAIAIAATFALAVSAAPKGTPGTTDEARVVALPKTTEDHLAMANSYDQKAAEWRKEAEMHREMARAYAAAHPDPKSGGRNPEAVKMEKHCMAIVHDAEKLAADAEFSARYHRERAKEMEAGR